MMFEGMGFWDDVNDWKPLNWELAVQARKLEMKLFKKMGVYKKVPRDVAKKRGCKVITTKRVDTNKGHTSRPNYRSRLVGRECKRSDRARAVSSCRHRHQTCILPRACRMRGPVAVKLVCHT